jgi:hypothetical protein
MRLSDLMSAANLTLYPQIALVMFVLLFAAALLYIFTRPKRHIDRMAQLPIDEHSDRTEAARHKESSRV